MKMHVVRKGTPSVVTHGGLCVQAQPWGKRWLVTVSRVALDGEGCGRTTSTFKEGVDWLNKELARLGADFKLVLGTERTVS